METGVVHLFIGLFQGAAQIGLQGDIALIHLIIEEANHIDEGNTVGGEPVDNLGIVCVAGGIGGVEQLGRLIVQGPAVRKTAGG